MTTRIRKFALTAHVALAVGWIGAVLAYLVLVAQAMTSEGPQTLRAAWIAMELIGLRLIVPLAVGALLSGLVMSLGTPWGLIRHYWVIVSLVLTGVATVILVQHMEIVSAFAHMAADADQSVTEILRGGLRGELLHAGGGLLVLLVIEAVNVLKPRGMTPYGRRRASHVASRSGPDRDPGVTTSQGPVAGMPTWVRVLGLHVVVLGLLLVIVLHLTGGGAPHR